ncbi:helix-turn-helix domain-containing protein [Rapidithrix thailandica]|uniref:Helix-turn-helix domain-containing protein n=1 Tax=Rapidithrix thailandica TaxID=413964 RepID=A0AAW9SFH6_9BACT
MRFHFHIPQSTLRHAVDYLYFNQAKSFEMKRTALPVFHQELVFNLGEGFEVCDFHETYNTGNYHSWLMGLHTRPVKTSVKGKHLSIGILFKPWGLYQLFGIHPSELSNNVLDSRLLLNSSLETFVKEQYDNSSPGQFLHLLEEFLVKNFPQQALRTEVIRSIDAIEGSHLQRGSIQKLSRELNLSPKSFIQIFNKTIGLSPLQYLHLKRVHTAIGHLTQCPEKSLTSLAYELGFYDQAHFTKMFKNFCGETPKAFRKRQFQQG